MVIDELMSAGHLVAEVPPPTLKKYALGKGVGDKGAMVDAAARRLPHWATGGQNDAVDALWLYKTNANVLGSGQPVLTGPTLIDKTNIDSVTQYVEQGTR